MRPVPKASVGMDGAALLDFLKWLGDQIVNPLRHLSIDFTRKDGPVAQHNRFLAERAVAASGVKGCRKAQDRVFNATLRGLEAATGKRLPKGCFR